MNHEQIVEVGSKILALFGVQAVAVERSSERDTECQIFAKPDAAEEGRAARILARSTLALLNTLIRTPGADTRVDVHTDKLRCHAVAYLNGTVLAITLPLGHAGAKSLRRSVDRIVRNATSPKRTRSRTKTEPEPEHFRPRPDDPSAGGAADMDAWHRQPKE
jgi:hypothetical protein